MVLPRLQQGVPLRQLGPSHGPDPGARSKERIARNQRFVIEYLRSHPCVDCGETDLVVLELDHLRDKVAGISRMVHTSELARVVAEIEKCEVVCANCHRRRTAHRGGWYRTKT